MPKADLPPFQPCQPNVHWASSHLRHISPYPASQPCVARTAVPRVQPGDFLAPVAEFAQMHNDVVPCNPSLGGGLTTRPLNPFSSTPSGTPHHKPHVDAQPTTALATTIMGLRCRGHVWAPCKIRMQASLAVESTFDVEFQPDDAQRQTARESHCSLPQTQYSPARILPVKAIAFRTFRRPVFF